MPRKAVEKRVEDVLAELDLSELDIQEFNHHFPQTSGGKPNPDRMRAFMYLAENMILRLHSGQLERMPPGMNATQLRSLVESIAKHAYDMDPRRLHDTRSDAEILADCMRDIAQHPDRIFELQDEQLDAMDRAFDTIDQMSASQIRQYVDKAVKESCLGKGERIRRIRTWIRRIREIRDRVRNPWVKDQIHEVAGEYDQYGQEAAHVWRHSAYIRRSGMTQEGDAPSTAIMDFGPHHAKMCVDVWEAENGVLYEQETDERDWFIAGTKIAPRKGKIKYRGAIVVCPPAHSKTEFAQGWTTLRICKNPKTQGLYLGAKDDLAQASLAYVGNAFTDDDAAGRRNRALFPNLIIDGRISQAKFRVKTDTRKKTTTLSACGSMSEIQGVDHDFQVHDDVVPQSDAESETERERRKQRLGGTIKMRLRGDRHFTLVVCTLWHQYDANMVLIDRAKKGEAMVLVSKQVCGGPTTTPKFFSLWNKITPEMLRQKFQSDMNGDLRLWSATHQGNPRPDEIKIIKQVRTYDIDDPDGTHAMFLKAEPIRWLSIDPTWSMRKGADKTGFVWAAVGVVSWNSKDDLGNPVRRSETRLRIMDADEFPANAAVVSARTKAFALSRPVDNVLIESESGGAVIADMLEKETGCPVQRILTGKKDKEMRLRRVARLIEDDTKSWSINRAVVEFPVRYVDGKRVWASEAVGRLVEEIVDFGICPHDHMLDALTQLIWRVAADLSPGTGEWSEAIARNVDDGTSVDPRKERMLREFSQPQDSRNTAQEEDWNFIARLGGDWYG